MPTPAQESRKRSFEALEKIAREKEVARQKELEETERTEQLAKEDAKLLLPECKKNISAAEDAGKFMVEIPLGAYNGRVPNDVHRFAALRAMTVCNLLIAEGYRARVVEQYVDAIADEMPAMTYVKLIIEW